MKSTRSRYHYKLKDLKRKKQCKIKQSISRDMLTMNNNGYWKSIRGVRKHTYNSTPIVDGIQGNSDIANHFMEKYKALYNSVMCSNAALNN